MPGFCPSQPCKPCQPPVRSSAQGASCVFGVISRPTWRRILCPRTWFILDVIEPESRTEISNQPIGHFTKGHADAAVMQQAR